MKWLDWKSRAFRRRVFGVVALLLLLAFAAHPELRLLAPFMDAAALDLMFAVLSLQVVAFFTINVRPLLLLLWRGSAALARGIEATIESIAPARGARNFVGRVVASSGSDWDRLVLCCCACLWQSVQAGPGGGVRRAGT